MKKYILLASLLCSCAPQTDVPFFRRDGGMDGGLPCDTPPPDTDGDGISDVAEGTGDSDGDGIPDYKDYDSDGDGIPDAIEGRNANTCTPPFDSDGDGKPDFRDIDSDSATDSTISDREEVGPDPTHPLDTDSDGIPDYADEDNDGDLIPDIIELTPTGGGAAAITLANAPDTDQDGIPDFRDTDSDNDGILDAHEGSVDTDGDLTGNYRDLDSDGDCVPDAVEAGDVNPNTPPVDSDNDMAPDFQDRDSDNDGLTDDKEDLSCDGLVGACETDRLKPDSDGDSVTDLIEQVACKVKPLPQQAACNCDGADAAKSPLTRGDFVFLVDYMQPPSPTLSTLDLSTDVSQADVMLTLDSTGSMFGCLNRLAMDLSSIVVPAAKAQVKSVAFGVMDYKDFNNSTPLSSYVIRYGHRIQTVNTVAGTMSVQTVLNAETPAGGGDGPEAGYAALYAIAGGPTIVQSYSPGYTSAINLAAINPTTPTAGEVQGTVGGAGFRQGSVPIIVTVADAVFHDNDYGTPNPTPSRAQALAQLALINAHVIGLAALGSQQIGDPKAAATSLATATGAVVSPADFGPVGTRPGNCPITQCCTGQDGLGEAASGGMCPLSYTVNGDSGAGVSTSLVSGIVALANGLKFDIHVEASDVDPNTVNNFIDKLVPNLSGVGPATVCITSAPPGLQDYFAGPKAQAPGPDGVKDTFPQISGGKRICFDVVPKMNQTVMNTGDPQLFRARLQVRGASGTSTVNLGTPREVFFLVPPVIVNGPIN